MKYIELLDQIKGGSTSAMGASKLLKRPNSTLWSPVQRANQEDPEAENRYK